MHIEMEIGLLKKFENWEKDFVICDYAQKLIDKLVCLNNAAGGQLVDIEIIKKAIYYAKKYHADQKRQSGEPFYSHPLEVAYMLSDYMFRTDVIVSAILHDTIEDTELTKEKIAQEFGVQIANQVMDLTRIKEDGTKISSAKMVEILYEEKKYDVLLIKLFDRLHNMQTIGAKSPAKIKKIVEETIIHFFLFGQHLEISKFTNEIEILSAKFLTSSDCISAYFSFNFYNLPLLNFQNTLIPTNILYKRE